jgi:hypothetical protein
MRCQNSLKMGGVRYVKMKMQDLAFLHKPSMYVTHKIYFLISIVWNSWGRSTFPSTYQPYTYLLIINEITTLEPKNTSCLLSTLFDTLQANILFHLLTYLPMINKITIPEPSHNHVNSSVRNGNLISSTLDMQSLRNGWSGFRRSSN